MKGTFTSVVLAASLVFSGVAFADSKQPVKPQATAAKPAAATATRPATPQQRGINVNTADAAALSSALVGVGPQKAQAIVDWRKKNGAFSSLAQLQQVKGIGPATIEKNRHLIVFR